MKTLIYPEWLIDGTGQEVQLGKVLVIDESGRIEAVTGAGEVEPGVTDQVVRAPGQTLLPGLINMHAHLTLVNDNAPFVPYMQAQSDVALALRAAHNAVSCLRAGVTTVRDCGSRGRTVLDLRAAISEGLVPGPRVVAAGWALTISGGHMRPFGGEVDGVDGVSRMVRTLVSAGADFIKVAGSGGGTPGSLADLPSFSPDEFRAIADAAHDLGRRVTIHGDRGTPMASRSVALLLADLGVIKSHSRPHCSNDHPYTPNASSANFRFRHPCQHRRGSIAPRR
jgi:imidazolonepropionase-like amidohydrolase